MDPLHAALHANLALFPIEIRSSIGIVAVLLGVLALIFWLTQQRFAQSFFRVVPALVFCYFIPTALTTAGVLPAEAPVYGWIKGYLLPVALFLLILSLDLPGILRLGPKAGIMLLSGTVGVVIGGPIALAIGQFALRNTAWALPSDTWQGLAALSGSWIGGGANFLALADIFGTGANMLAAMVVVDVLIANIWMGVLLYCAGRQHEIDRWTGADASAIRNLEQRLTAFQERVTRIPTLADLLSMLALGFLACWISVAASDAIGRDADQQVHDAAVALGITEVRIAADEAPVPLEDAQVKSIHIGRAIEHRVAAEPHALDVLSNGQQRHLGWARFVNEITGAGMWKYVIVTTLALLLSFTPVRNLEGAGASKLGSVLLYLLVACIGASANFAKIGETPGFFVVGALWMLVHIIVLLGVAWLIKAPIFFVAVGSQANIGGAASAPIVASAYHPALAPVGVLLAVAGYVLGTYAGIVCGWLLQSVAQLN